MTKNEKLKRQDAMRKIDQEADCGGHNKPLFVSEELTIEQEFLQLFSFMKTSATIARKKAGFI